MPDFATLNDKEVTGRRVLVRVDLNVPMRGGKIADATRITRVLPTIRSLADKGAKIVLLSHFGRPKGGYNPDLSLAPVADALDEALPGITVKFGVDCIGPEAERAVEELAPGDVILMENLRFHPEEKQNDPGFVQALATLGDLYVNDAFSCSHRAHASITGLAEALPAMAGLLLEAELNALERYLSRPEAPVAAFIGGSKISTKLGLLGALTARMDRLVIGGGMANTFLHAQGHPVGASLCETDMKDTARDILRQAEDTGCEIILPEDLVVAECFAPHAPCRILPVGAECGSGTILDMGPASVAAIHAKLKETKTLVWNGPLGAFETAPFDGATVQLARQAAALTAAGSLSSIAGGGDTVAALAHAGLVEQFTYVSTAGGAFLAWLEGQTLPGIAALQSI